MKNMKTFLIVVITFICVSVSNSQSNWELEKDENKIKVWTRDCVGSKIKEFKMETIIDENLNTVVAGLIDIDKLSDWYMYINQVRVDTIIGNNRVQYFMVFDLPWPVRDRYAEIDASITLNENGAQVSLKAFDGSVKENEGMVRVLVMRASYNIQKINELQTKIIHTGHMEPAGYIPAWLANSGVSDGPIESFTRFKNVLPKYRGVAIPIK